MLFSPHTTKLGDISDTLHNIFYKLYVDERMTPVPRLTGSSSADCDAQSNESALHIDEPTEQDMSPLTESIAP